MGSVAEAFRRVADEYEVARRDSVRRHFLVQFMNRELKGSLLGLVDRPKMYRVRMPNYAKNWPELPWFAVTPKRVVVDDRIYSGTVFVLDPGNRRTHVIGELATAHEPIRSLEMQLGDFTTNASDARLTKFVSSGLRGQIFDTLIFKERPLDSLDDSLLRADIKTVDQHQERLISVLNISGTDLLLRSATELAHSPGQRVKREEQTREKNRELYPVWYCTSRKPVSPCTGPVWYSNVREEPEKVHHGVCMVAISETHRFGAKPSSWWKRLIHIDSNDFFLESARPLGDKEFWENAARGLNAMDVHEKDALVYIHGFGASFEDSICRAAQIGHDIKFPGITTAFSWPSKGNLLPQSYAADNATIGAHCGHITNFIAGLISRCNCHRVHIVAHSLGSLAVLRACAGAHVFTRDQRKRIGQVIFAAADVDDQEFVKYAPKTPSVRTTLYASSKDSALKLSSGWNSYKRAGLLPPPTVADRVDTVDVGPIDLSEMGHGYIAEAHAVLYDVFTLIRHNTPPDARIRIKPVSHGLSKYWKFA